MHQSGIFCRGFSLVVGITNRQIIIGDFIYTEKEPLRDDIIGLLKQKPALKERKTIAERIKDKILGFVETFINGISEGAKGWTNSTALQKLQKSSAIGLSRNLPTFINASY
ncbi:hypothetical protein ADIS_0469 [Lunatimonas lonarensis]|uniref:Uncharacterized protein n=1 Tax=Lunatimonas lonarensis TaxID=1232681 RepID=R7ZY92_9BACT|nr:hypothetical protein [Lunatimonas lonarensis]EON79052.1 hypothetical protein ADIS_0469 [Lunatimonas lonarensis]